MLNELGNLLECLSFVGVDEVALEPQDDGNVLVRGAASDMSVIVYDKISMDLDKPVGIQSVKALLSRINLMAGQNASITFSGDDEVREIIMKKGRSKVTYRTADISRLYIPKFVPDDIGVNDDNYITFSAEYIKKLNNVFASIGYTGVRNEQYISIESHEDEIRLTVSDGEDDSFNDQLEMTTVSNNDRASWDIKAFQRVMKTASDYSTDNEAKFSVNQRGCATFDVGVVEVIVAPFA